MMPNWRRNEEDPAKTSKMKTAMRGHDKPRRSKCRGGKANSRKPKVERNPTSKGNS